MAKRKSYKKKSSKCPEPFNTLIDIAGGMTMNAIANKMEKKHHYRKRGVPNPYRVSAFGLSTGRLKNTEDIIRLGGLMGAMGSFDDDPYAEPKRRSYDIPWQFDDLGVGVEKPNNNRYAWRLNCEDGRPYGVNPEDYESREAYNLALERAKNLSTEAQEEVASEGKDRCDNVQPLQDGKMHLLCKVSRLDNGKNEYFIADGFTPAVGDTVIIPDEAGIEQRGIVITVEQPGTKTASQVIANTPHIIRII